MADIFDFCRAIVHGDGIKRSFGAAHYNARDPAYKAVGVILRYDILIHCQSAAAGKRAQKCERQALRRKAEGFCSGRDDICKKGDNARGIEHTYAGHQNYKGRKDIECDFHVLCRAAEKFFKDIDLFIYAIRKDNGYYCGDNKRCDLHFSPLPFRVEMPFIKSVKVTPTVSAQAAENSIAGRTSSGALLP